MGRRSYFRLLDPENDNGFDFNGFAKFCFFKNPSQWKWAQLNAISGICSEMKANILHQIYTAFDSRLINASNDQMMILWTARISLFYMDYNATWIICRHSDFFFFCLATTAMSREREQKTIRILMILWSTSKSKCLYRYFSLSI